MCFSCGSRLAHDLGRRFRSRLEAAHNVTVDGKRNIAYAATGHLHRPSTRAASGCQATSRRHAQAIIDAARPPATSAGRSRLLLTIGRALEIANRALVVQH